MRAELKVQLDRGARPFQTVHQLFQYRNWLAHTHCETIPEETLHREPVDDAFLFKSPQHKWEKFVTVATAERALEDVKNLIEALNVACPFPERISLAKITSHTYSTELQSE